MKTIVKSTLAAALVLSCYGTASAAVFWVSATASETYHDQQSAHDAARRDAFRAADAKCTSGTTIAQAETAVHYTQGSDGWTATVSVHEVCDIPDDQP